ncbi:Gfo/Idh/MocA family oxidoreductase [Candidatus Daviesbacteria bacterium]|nr:Gfo/Idh/MocA family oxidoreductase [Candidatus Daviesbacteria bacterium]
MITLALIGVGKWGKNYLNTATTLANVKIKYICARSKKTLDLLPDTYIQILSVKNLLKKRGVDGFIIASPASTHFAIANQLLSLGCNLLIEKPLAISYDQALQLKKIWQMKKPKVLIGHLYLYNPAYQVFRKKFKRIKKVKSIFFEGTSSPVRKDVSVIWDWGPHPVSLLLDLVKYPILKVSATGSKKAGNTLYDSVEALIYFINGIKSTIRISWFGSHKVRRLIVKGGSEKLELDFTNTTDQKILLHKMDTPPEYPKYKPDSALTEELSEFVKAIQGFKKITSDINFGVKVVKVLSAIEQSVENNGQAVALKHYK